MQQPSSKNATSVVLLAGVRASVRSRAFNATNRLHWTLTQRLRGHRYDAESALRLYQTQVRKPVCKAMQS